MTAQLDPQQLLEAITDVQSLYIEDKAPKTVFEELLKQLLTITGSEYGFIGEVLGQPDAPYLKTHAITNIAWDEETRRFYEESAPHGLEFHKLDNLFGEVIGRGHLVISNDPSSDPRRGGLPEGHPPLRCFCGIPLHYGQKLVGMVGIANRPEGYNEDFASELGPLIASITRLTIAVQRKQRHQQALQQLLEQQRRHDFVIDGARVGIWEWNPQTDEMYVNKHWAALLGHTPEEIGTDVEGWASRVHPEDMPAINALVEEYFAGNIPVYQNVHRLRHKDGHYVYHLSFGEVVEWQDGKPVRFLGTHTDITAERLATQRAREAAQAKRNFITNVSHELRTPLNAILGFTGLLNDSGLNARQSEYVKTIEASGQMLLTLVNDILDFSKLEAGKISLSQEPFSLSQLVQETLGLFATSCQQKAIALISHIDPALPDQILGDKVRLRQILVNLLSNSVKFTEAGFIDVKVKPDPRGPEWLVFLIKDSGVGITPSTLKRVFEPFEQQDPSTTRRFGGTGLGLTISAHLASLMGGQLELRSEGPDQGTEATLSLPMTEARVLSRRPSSSDALPCAVEVPTMSVLVVEDNGANQRLMAELLKKLNQEVHIVDNGLAAFAAIAEKPYDIVFMDIQMPKLDGVSTLNRIRTELPGDRARHIYAVTADLVDDARQRYHEVGFAGFIGKPLSTRALTEAILETAQSLGFSEPGLQANEDIINWSQIDALAAASDLNPEVFENLLSGFEDNLREGRGELLQALSEGDEERARFLAHRLYGSCITYGAVTLSQSLRLLCDSTTLPVDLASSYRSLIKQQSDDVLKEMAEKRRRFSEQR